MRLLATFAAVATVNALTDENSILSRVRRDDDDLTCEEQGLFPTVGGFCTDTPALAREIATEVSATLDGEARKFPMGGQSPSIFFNDGIERTKRRSQRLTLLLAKVISGGSVSDRNTGKKLKSREFMMRVNQYGCHCWPKSDKEHLAGSGKPLDQVDSACWALKTCHKCIEIDYPLNEDRPQGCDPVTTKYKAKLSRQENGELEITCSNSLNKKGSNNGDCKRSLCECDKAFAENFANNFEEWDASNWKLEEKGEYDDKCKKVFRGSMERLTSGEGKDQCCGNYPAKKPFNSQTHQCIDGEVTQDNFYSNL